MMPEPPNPHPFLDDGPDSPRDADAGAVFVLESKGQWWHAGFHLTTAIVGPTILTLPYAFRGLGWPVGFLCLTAMGIVTFYSYYLMSKVLDHCEKAGRRHIRFRELAADVLGSGGMFYFVIFIQTAINTGVGIGAILLAGECVKIMYTELSPNGSLKLYHFIAMVTVVMMVISQLPSFHSLRHINLGSLLLSLGYSFLAVVACIYAVWQTNSFYVKLQMELKKLQKSKEFKPTMALPIIPSQKDKKKKGGPEMKRPSPPYVLWCKDQWNQVKQENPEAEFKDISSILGAKWKTVTAEEKKPYEEKYQAEKEAYLQVMAKEKRESEAMHLFEEEHKQKTAMELLEQYMQFKQEAEKDGKKNKKEKDPLKPKQPVSAFFLFTNERRAALNAQNIKSVLEVARITGEEWKNMTDEQKGPYEEMAKKNKEKYMQEMEVYKQQKEEEVAILRKEEEEMMKLQKHEAFQLLKKKEKTENIIKKTKEIEKKKKEEKKVVDPNKPKRPASSYILFSKEARKNLMEERPGINNSTITALISVKWKELSEEDRKVWNDQAAEAMEAYKKELEEYNKSVAASIQD